MITAEELREMRDEFSGSFTEGPFTKEMHRVFDEVERLQKENVDLVARVGRLVEWVEAFAPLGYSEDQIARLTK